MKLRDAQKAVIVQFAGKFPMPLGDAAISDWTHRLAEQLAWSFPAEGWAHKSAGPGRPHSKDCIAIREPFVGWDVIGAAGQPGQTLQLDGEAIDLAGQLVEIVTPTDHLGAAPPAPPNPPPAPGPTACACAAQLDAILAELVAQRKAVEAAVVDLKLAKEQALPALLQGVKIRF